MLTPAPAARAARRSAHAADRRPARPPGPPADASGHPRLERRAAELRRARMPRPALRLPERLHRSTRQTEVTGGDLDTLEASSPQHGAARSGRRSAPVPDARDRSRVRARTARRRRAELGRRHAGFSCSSPKRRIFAAPSSVVGWTSSTRSKTTSGPRSTTPPPRTTPRRSYGSSSRSGASGGFAAISPRAARDSSRRSRAAPK